MVARRPSSSPAAASTKAPVQVDTIRAPGDTNARARATVAGASRSGMWNGGTMTVRKASGPCSTVIEKSALVRTGRPSAVQVATS